LIIRLLEDLITGSLDKLPGAKLELLLLEDRVEILASGT
jgi:hypothetical protein